MSAVPIVVAALDPSLLGADLVHPGTSANRVQLTQAFREEQRWNRVPKSVAEVVRGADKEYFEKKLHLYAWWFDA